MRRLLLCLVLSVGCDFFDGGDPPPTARGSLGDRCSDEEGCRPGLTCDPTIRECVAARDAMLGDTCELTGDCVDGLYCAADRTCTMAGAGESGDTCGTTGDCAAGLLCVLDGFYGACTDAGSGDIGAECEAATECAAGLSCAAGQCISANAAPPGTSLPPSVPFWAGEECPADSATLEAYFEVPRFDGMDNDFYRLPFPNDIRRTASGLDLRNHPAPPTAVGGGVIDHYLRVAEEDMRGFSLNPVAYFRMSAPYDWDTVGSSLSLVNIDPDSPRFGQEVGIAWLTTFGPITKYICENWVGVRTIHGAPLDPETTYAVIADRTLLPRDGGTFARASDLDAILAESAPSDGVLRAAWERYEPFRAWLSDGETPSVDEVLTAAVFTTQPLVDMSAARDAIHASTLPTITDLTLCEDGVTSPCDDGTPQRACGSAAADYVEVHGRISVPIYQQGNAPYELPDDGGGVLFGSDGAPVPVRNEDVCFALTLPRTAAPAEGWPVVVTLHGTGGSFRTAINSGGAEAFARGDLASAAVPTATMAIDLPQHGDRRQSDGSPDILFFNFRNPRAAWGNSFQGATDLFAVVRWLAEGGVDADASPTGEAISFDPARIATFTHSQGSNHAALALPYEPSVLASILSGNSGDLTLSLLNKTSPVDIAGVVPFALFDADAEGRLAATNFHPVLALWQGYFDTVDPVNYARPLRDRPVAGVPLKHVLMTFGVGDTFSPEPNMEAYAAAAGLPHVQPHALELNLRGVDAPFSANVRDVDDALYTHALRSYAPTDGEDGHFVATRTDAGREDTRRFLLEALSGEIPVVP